MFIVAAAELVISNVPLPVIALIVTADVPLATLRIAPDATLIIHGLRAG